MLNALLAELKDWVMVLTPVLVVLVGKLSFDNLKLKRRQRQIAHPESSISVKVSIPDYNRLREDIIRMFRDSSAERYLILLAVNGRTSPRFVTVIAEEHQFTSSIHLSIGATSKYIHIDVDAAYREMLKDAETSGPQYLVVSQMQDCLLKNIYEAEEIKVSSVYFIKRLSLNDTNDALLFGSIASHSAEEFTIADRILMESVMRKTILFSDAFDIRM